MFKTRGLFVYVLLKQSAVSECSMLEGVHVYVTSSSFLFYWKLGCQCQLKKLIKY